MLQVDSQGVVTGKINLEKFGKQAKETEKATKRLDDVLKGLSPSAIASAGGVLVLYNAFQKLVGSVVNFGKSSIDSFAQFETLQTNLEVVIGSAEKGREIFEDLRKFSVQTPFGVDTLTGAYTQLVQVGDQIEFIKDDLLMLSDLSTGSQAKFQSILETYTKILASGKASSREIMSLANQGLPIREELKKMGVTGSASANQIIKAFQEMTKEGGKFYQSSEKGNQTITGKTAYFVDTMKELKVSFAEVSGLAETYKGILDKANEFIQGIVDNLGQLKKYKDAGLTIWDMLFPDEADLKKIGEINFSNLDIEEQIKALDEEMERLTAEKLSYVRQIDEINEELEDSWITKGSRKKLEKRKEELQSQLNDDIYLLADYRKQREKLVNQQVEDVSTPERKKIEEVKTSWREFWKSVTGVKLDDEDNGLIAGSKTVDRIQQDIKDKLSLKNIFEGENFINTASVYESQINSLQKKLESLLENKDIDSPFSLEDNSIKALLKELDELKKKRIEALDVDLSKENKQMQDILDSTESRRQKLVEIYALENKMTVSEANRLYDLQNENKELSEQLAKIKEMTALTKSNNLKNIDSTFSDNITKSLSNALGDSDTLDFRTLFDGFSNGMKGFINSISGAQGVMGALIMVIEQLVSATMDYVSELDETGIVTKPFNTWIKHLGTSLQGFYEITKLVNEGVDEFLGVLDEAQEMAKPILVIIKFLSQIVNAFIKELVEAINWIQQLGQWITNIFSFGIFNILSNLFDETFSSTQDEKQKELDRIKELNKQYQSLSQAIDEQEQYYLKRKQELNAGSYNENINRVNDMILTPRGTFSTHPDDTIIAMKHPEQLANRSQILQPIINDYGGNNIEVSRETDANGMERLIVNISKKVASDMANGYNGWDNAMAMRQARINGRGFSR